MIKKGGEYEKDCVHESLVEKQSLQKGDASHGPMFEVWWLGRIRPKRGIHRLHIELGGLNEWIGRFS